MLKDKNFVQEIMDLTDEIQVVKTKQPLAQQSLGSRPLPNRFLVRNPPAETTTSAPTDTRIGNNAAVTVVKPEDTANPSLISRIPLVGTGEN